MACQNSYFTARLCWMLLFGVLGVAFAGPQPENPESEQLVPAAPLKTQLPFHPTCGMVLTTIPPNDILVTDFAQKTAIQAFTYDYQSASSQFDELEDCFTETGWKSFTSALKVSGNIDAAKKEHLFASAHVDGEPLIIDANANAAHWQVLVPLIVRYENKRAAMEQHLRIKLTVTIEDKHLGVEQLIATASGSHRNSNASQPQGIEVEQMNSASSKADKSAKATDTDKPPAAEEKPAADQPQQSEAESKEDKTN